MSNGVKTCLVKPTETAELNKGELRDPRLMSERPAWDLSRPSEHGCHERTSAIYGASGGRPVFISRTQMDFGSPFHMEGCSLSLDT
ncbi:hypothetical protein I79_001935 [Cricetulus griseus]|uniref:Uncharacterized protein n=1 Tax=Cricetulus griseus TaxID=10029 RepID=G3GW24_CRIGR|nr:hypothetical protein I79_001935 [Cricetulus griseus]